MKLYVDGEFDTEGDITQFVKENENNTSKFYLGGEPGRPHVIERSIDEVAVFNTVLTDADVETIYQKGLEYALGITAVSSSGKLALTWGGLKSECGIGNSECGITLRTHPCPSQEGKAGASF